MEFLGIVFFRTVVVYFIVLFIFRIMGKRELGELSILDFVIFLFVAEMATLAIEDMDKPFWKSMLPVFFLFGIQIIMSYIILKSKNIRNFIEGEAVLIISNGVIMEDAMRKERYNLDDLMQQLREQGVSTVQDVTHAFLEQSGKLSVYLKSTGPYAYPLISDGDIDVKNLSKINRTEQWLLEQLYTKGYNDPKQIFFCYMIDDELFIQLKSRK